MLNILAPEAHYTLAAEDVQAQMEEIEAQEKLLAVELEKNTKKIEQLSA